MISSGMVPGWIRMRLTLVVKILAIDAKANDPALLCELDSQGQAHIAKANGRDRFVLEVQGRGYTGNVKAGALTTLPPRKV